MSPPGAGLPVRSRGLLASRVPAKLPCPLASVPQLSRSSAKQQLAPAQPRDSAPPLIPPALLPVPELTGEAHPPPLRAASAHGLPPRSAPPPLPESQRSPREKYPAVPERNPLAEPALPGHPP